MRDFIEGDVADQSIAALVGFVVDAIDSNIDYDCAFANVVGPFGSLALPAFTLAYPV